MPDLTQLPPPPSYMNRQLAQVLDAHGGLFWLEGEHQDSSLGLIDS